ncbi:MAG: VOC family protein [Sphingomonas sp.]|nr:VOC family protein [Sphingomonas sp.]
MTNVRNWLIDHTGIGVSDIHRSADFYEAVLAPLGASAIMRISRTFGPAGKGDDDLGGVAFGIDYPMFWIDVFHPHGVKQHHAFRATSRAQVDAFHKAGLAAGGVDNGRPGLRTGGYPPGYYAAFLLDPDGNNVEALFRQR